MHVKYLCLKYRHWNEEKVIIDRLDGFKYKNLIL